tara:strand:+ start:117 stop:311 length:195 start_codon:yes stop_codon:yes gene_type:complete
MDVTVEITIDGEVYEVEGTCNFYGPHNEAETYINSIYPDPGVSDAVILEEARALIEDMAWDLNH